MNGRAKMTARDVGLARDLASLGYAVLQIARWLGKGYDAVRHAVRHAAGAGCSAVRRFLDGDRLVLESRSIDRWMAAFMLLGSGCAINQPPVKTLASAHLRRPTTNHEPAEEVAR